MEFADDDTRFSYEGEFIESEMTGHGQLTFRTGEVFTGTFLNGLLNGQAMITFGDSSDTKSFVGWWENGKSVGDGILTLKNGMTSNATYDCETVNGTLAPCTLEPIEMTPRTQEIDIATATEPDLSELLSTPETADAMDETTTYVSSGYETTVSSSLDIIGPTTGSSSTEGTLSDGKVFQHIYNDDGSVYFGEILDSFRHGFGTMIFPVTDERLNYTGQFWMDKISGNGSMVWKNGDRYQGEWLNGLKHGQGTLEYSDDNELLSYSGSWKEDHAQGLGTLIWRNGENYTGGVEDGHMSGQGVFHWPDGRVYEGHFANGLRQGFGKLKFLEDNPIDLDYYEGQWKDDSATGFGRMVWKNGQRHEGYFRNGLQEGGGVLYSAENSVVEEGKWHEGQYVE